MNNLKNVRGRMMAHAAGKVLILLLMVVLISACEKEENQSKYNPPADHTVSQDGVMHRSGLEQPLTNCVGCHGADLTGGNVGVSCYECHGKKW